jgi:hypothetical protein
MFQHPLCVLLCGKAKRLCLSVGCFSSGKSMIKVIGL